MFLDVYPDMKPCLDSIPSSCCLPMSVFDADERMRTTDRDCHSTRRVSEPWPLSMRTPAPCGDAKAYRRSGRVRLCTPQALVTSTTSVISAVDCLYDRYLAGAVGIVPARTFRADAPRAPRGVPDAEGVMRDHARCTLIYLVENDAGRSSPGGRRRYAPAQRGVVDRALVRTYSPGYEEWPAGVMENKLRLVRILIECLHIIVIPGRTISSPQGVVPAETWKALLTLIREIPDLTVQPPATDESDN